MRGNQACGPHIAPVGGGSDCTGLHGQIDAHDTIVRSSKRVPGGIRRTEYRDNRRPDSTGQVHRSGVACDEHIETFEDRGQRRQVGVAGNVDDSTVAEPRT